MVCQKKVRNTNLSARSGQSPLPRTHQVVLGMVHYSSENLPMEIILEVLNFAAEMCCGNPSRRAWLAQLARVCSIAHRSVNKRLYQIIELDDVCSARLLLSTLLQRPDLAHFICALHLGMGIAANLLDGPDAHLTRQITTICKPQFVQSATGASPWAILQSQDDHTVLVPPTVPNYVSLIYERRGPAKWIPTVLYGVTHLHLGLLNKLHAHRLMMTFGSTAEKARTMSATPGVSWGITHLAIDFEYNINLMGTLRALLRELIRDDGSRKPIQRIVLRAPDSPVEWADFLLGNLGFLGDKRIAVHKIPHERTVGVHGSPYALAVDGWRRHAVGDEDLWLSGETVHWEET